MYHILSVSVYRQEHLRTHTSEPIPFLIWYPGIEPDEVQVYDEVAACNGSYGVLKEDEFIKEFMK